MHQMLITAEINTKQTCPFGTQQTVLNSLLQQKLIRENRQLTKEESIRVNTLRTVNRP